MKKFLIVNTSILVDYIVERGVTENIDPRESQMPDPTCQTNLKKVLSPQSWKQFTKNPK